MPTHADRTHENKRQSPANGVSSKQSSSESTFQFLDNRPEAVVQGKLLKLANAYSASKTVQRLEKDPVVGGLVKKKLNARRVFKIQKVENKKMYLLPTSGLQTNVEVVEDDWKDWEETTSETIQSTVTDTKEELKIPTPDEAWKLVRTDKWWENAATKVDIGPDSMNKDGDLVTVTLTAGHIPICVHLHVKTETGFLTSPGAIFLQGQRPKTDWTIKNVASGDALVNHCYTEFKTSECFPKKKEPAK